MPGLIFVVNGSGGGFEVTNGLWSAMAMTGDRFALDTVYWSRFQGVLRDSTDYTGHFFGAQDLVGRVLAARQLQPKRKLYIVGFSAGGRIAIGAATQLPPNSVDRIVLLGASATSRYHLGPVLRAARDGIDSFYNCADPVLYLGENSIGLADGTFDPAGGRVGFSFPPVNHPDFALYLTKLRQHSWDPSFRQVGHDRQHQDWPRPAVLATYVLPLLRESEWTK
jgi:pimeloyl-ACP methyl ester carboxylesterase